MTSNLAAHLEGTLSSDYKTRTDATNALIHASHQPGYGIALLHIVANNQLSIPIRQSSAINFKNYVNKYWPNTVVNADDEDHSLTNHTHVVISNEDKQLIKDNIIQLMLSIDIRSIQIQLSAALSSIASHDFPEQWQTLLPTLIAKIQTIQSHLSDADTSELQQLHSILHLLNSIFARYRYEKASDRLWSEIKYVLEQSQEDITSLFARVLETLQQTLEKQDKERLNLLFTVINDICHIFLSLNIQEIPEYFEDNISSWMPSFLQLLRFSSPLLDTTHSTSTPASAAATVYTSDSDSVGSNVQDSVHSVICEIATLYTQKYEDQFKDYVPDFVSTIWTLLTNLSDDTRYDQLVTSAIKFLTTVARKDWYKELFSNQQALSTLCEKVIIPQIKLRDSDMELFHDDPIEYVRRDIEGSDIDTRRRTTSDFVRGLCQHFEQQITNILMNYIQTLLQQYTSNPKQNFLLKDAAIYIVLAVGAKGRTSQRGVTQTNPHLDIQAFIQTQILPELQQPNSNQLPIIKADAIKFLNEFRSSIQPTSQISSAILPLIMKYLLAEQYVVYTYAAATIERILSMHDATTKHSVVTKQQLQPYLQQLLTSLFQALEHDDAGENTYIMKCIMRVCSIAQETMLPYASVVIERVRAKLMHVAQNPKNPNFNHYLFETIAALIQYIGKAQQSSVSEFEKALFPSFGQMLSVEFAAEFHSYVFQILSELLELNTSITPPFASIFPSLMAPQLYENLGNIPSLTRLITAYLQKGATQPPVSQKYDAILGIFQQLILKKATDVSGSQLLSAFFHYVPLEKIQQFLPPILRLIFQKIQRQPTNLPFIRSIISTLSLFIAQHGFDVLYKSFEEVQHGVFIGFYKAIWLHHATSILHIEQLQRKYTLVGLTVISCRTPMMLQEPLIQAWPQTVAAAIKLATATTSSSTSSSSGVTTNGIDSEVDLIEQSEQTFSTVYAKLVFSNPPDTDYLAHIQNPQQHFVDSLSQFTQQHPNQIRPLLQQMPKAEQEALSKLAGQYNRTI